MTDPVEPLIVDLLEWIGPNGRHYADVIDVWRTSCPRLPVWEEANARGYIATTRQPPGQPLHVSVSAAGTAHLAALHPASVNPVATPR